MNKYGVPKLKGKVPVQGMIAVPKKAGWIYRIFLPKPVVDN